MQLSNSEQSRLKTKYGTWAIVTGASSGIGRAIANCLAEAGFHLILNARRITPLEAFSTSLQAKYKIQTKVVPADLSKKEGVATVIQAANQLEVGLLVANAGFGTSGLFLNSDIVQEVNMLEVNCKAVLKLSHHFGQEFAAQKRGGIILLSSIVAFQGVPNAAHYAATKAYIQTLGEALAIELKKHNVDVLNAAPGPVESGFGERAKMDINSPLKPEDVAVPILKALGRRTNVLPGGFTKLLTYSLRTLPRWGKIRVMQQVMGGMIKN